jgi:hypothetical protein
MSDGIEVIGQLTRTLASSHTRNDNDQQKANIRAARVMSTLRSRIKMRARATIQADKLYRADAENTLKAARHVTVVGKTNVHCDLRHRASASDEKLSRSFYATFDDISMDR